MHGPMHVKLSLFVVYLTAMPVVQILSLLRRMQVTYEVWGQSLSKNRGDGWAKDTDPVKKTNMFYLRQYKCLT
jgi:hypothetical protein